MEDTDYKKFTMNNQFGLLKRRVEKITRKYGFPFKLTVFIAIILLCLVVLFLRISPGQALSGKALLGIGAVFLIACVGLWATFREREIERCVKKHPQKAKVRKK
jgi:amino acid transporter